MTRKYYGYDQNGIKRLYATDMDQCRKATQEYMASRLDCTRITWRPINARGRPMPCEQFHLFRRDVE